MAVLSVSIVLIASYPDGRNVGRSDFVDMLATPHTDSVTAVTFDDGPWASSKIEFLNRQLDGYQSHAEPARSFFEEIQKTLTDVAKWIDDRKAPLKNARELGLDVTLLVDMVIDQDQLDLILPAASLRAAGEAGQGTLRKGGEAMNIYRGNGLTVVTKPGGEWVTALKSGEGLDLAIRMLR